MQLLHTLRINSLIATTELNSNRRRLDLRTGLEEEDDNSNTRLLSLNHRDGLEEVAAEAQATVELARRIRRQRPVRAVTSHPALEEQGGDKRPDIVQSSDHRDMPRRRSMRTRERSQESRRPALATTHVLEDAAEVKQSRAEWRSIAESDDPRCERAHTGDCTAPKSEESQQDEHASFWGVCATSCSSVAYSNDEYSSITYTSTSFGGTSRR